MKFKVTEKFKNRLKMDIPYTEDSNEWHVWLDICSVYSKDKLELNILEMVKIHNTDFKYYSDYLPVLEADGYLKIIQLIKD